jgi:hypothetical protein
MKFILATLLTALLAFLAGLVLPWWSIAVISFLVAALLRQPLGKSFLAAFTAIFLMWGLLATWIDFKNEGVLSNKIAQLFSLGNSLLLILITAILGALVAGLAAVCGASLIKKPVERRQ